MRWLYEFIYRFPFVPIEWIFGSHPSPELEQLVETGSIVPGRAIELGCGVGLDAIYLAKKGFDVTGIDFSVTAIKRARANAQMAGVAVNFVEDDLTNLRQVSGTFDFILDSGAMNDLRGQDRDLYMQNVLPLTQTGTQYLLMCFENALPTSEIEQRFGEHFGIETVSKKIEGLFGREIAFHYMTRR